MKAALEKEIVSQCPLLYRSVDARIPMTLFGIECGDGWYTLILELSQKLEKLISNINEAEQKNYCVMQVKEKFGTLRFYMSLGTDAMFDLIEIAEENSAKICEVCGGVGKLRVKRGWGRTICDVCNIKKE